MSMMGVNKPVLCTNINEQYEAGAGFAATIGGVDGMSWGIVLRHCARAKHCDGRYGGGHTEIDGMRMDVPKVHVWSSGLDMPEVHVLEAMGPDGGRRANKTKVVIMEVCREGPPGT